jgi:hypothetical protein
MNENENINESFFAKNKKALISAGGMLALFLSTLYASYTYATLLVRLFVNDGGESLGVSSALQFFRIAVFIIYSAFSYLIYELIIMAVYRSSLRPVILNNKDFFSVGQFISGAEFGIFARGALVISNLILGSLSLLIFKAAYLYYFVNLFLDFIITSLCLFGAFIIVLKKYFPKKAAPLALIRMLRPYLVIYAALTIFQLMSLLW